MGRQWKFSPAQIVPSPFLITPLPANAFPYILAPNVPNNIRSSIIGRIPPCSFASFLVVSLIPFINCPASSSDVTVFSF